jgi:hypothetical protein
MGFWLDVFFAGRAGRFAGSTFGGVSFRPLGAGSSRTVGAQMAHGIGFSGEELKLKIIG